MTNRKSSNTSSSHLHTLVPMWIAPGMAGNLAVWQSKSQFSRMGMLFITQEVKL